MSLPDWALDPEDDEYMCMECGGPSDAWDLCSECDAEWQDRKADEIIQDRLEGRRK